jgi:hypothetical protein
MAAPLPANMLATTAENPVTRAAGKVAEKVENLDAPKFRAPESKCAAPLAELAGLCSLVQACRAQCTQIHAMQGQQNISTVQQLSAFMSNLH